MKVMRFLQWLDESVNAQAKLMALCAKNNPEAAKKVTQQDLNHLEKMLDNLFKGLNIDIEFTRHFLDRVNDARNKKDITVAELEELFRKAYSLHGRTLTTKPDDFQAVIKSVSSNINVPFVLNLNKKGMIELVAKTVMRKADFKTPNPELKV